MSLKLWLLGEHKILTGTAQEPNFISNKAKALLIYLAVEQRQHSRVHLASLFWSEMDDTRAKKNLRTALTNLRTIAGDHLSITRQSVEVQEGGDPWIDVLDFERLALARDAESLGQAADLHGGNFLDGLALRGAPMFDEWVSQRRQQLARQRIDVLNRLVQLHIDNNQYQSARTRLQQIIDLEPWQEEAHRKMMILLAASGQEAKALQQYQSLQRILTQEINGEPSPETKELREQIAEGDFDEDEWIQTDITRVQAEGIPAPVTLHGRKTELGKLATWLNQTNGPMVAVLGIGGQGKTAIAGQAVRNLQQTTRFTRILWRTLVNAPPLEDILLDAVQHFTDHDIARLPDTDDQQIRLLIEILRNQPCLLVLDNLESLMQASGGIGRFKQEYEGYGRLLRAVAQGGHQSGLLITSREQPTELNSEHRETGNVHILRLHGVPSSAAYAIASERGLTARTEAIDSITDHYGGNPLAMLVVCDAIRDFFGGDVESFQQEGPSLFDNIQSVLSEQVARLTPLEYTILMWLATKREPITFPDLYRDMIEPPARSTVLTSLVTLQRRSMINEQDGGFTLQNVILEFMTGRFIEKIASELRSSRLDLLHSHPIMMAQAKEYVRVTQRRLIGQPIADATDPNTLQRVLREARGDTGLNSGYAFSNLLHLAILAGADLTTMTFTKTTLRNVHLRDQWVGALDLTGVTFHAASFTRAIGRCLGIAYSPDGKLLATATATGELYVWNLDDYQVAHILEGHEGIAIAVIFSPDGKWIVSGGFDCTIRIWDVESGICKWILRGHDKLISWLTFQPNSGMLVSASDDGTMRAWEYDHGRRLFRERSVLYKGTARLRSAAFSTDGRLVATGGDDRRIHLIDTESGMILRQLDGHCDDIKAVGTVDQQTLISGSADNTIGLWNMDTGERLRQIQQPSHVESMATDSDGVHFVTGNADWVARVWNAQTGELVQTLIGHEAPIKGIAMHPDGTQIATAATDYTVRVWDRRTGDPIRIISGHRNQLQHLTISHDGSQLIAKGDYPVRQVWRLSDATAHPVYADEPGNPLAATLVEFHPTKPLIATREGDTILLRGWSTDRADVLREFLRLPGIDPSATKLRFSPGGAFVVGYGRRNEINLWHVGDADHGATPRAYRLEGHDNMVEGIAFWGEQFLLTGGLDRRICVWDLSDADAIPLAREMQIPDAHDVALSLAIDSTGTVVACGAANAICLFELRTGELLTILRGTTGWSYALSFSNDGTLLFAGDEAPAIHAWRVADWSLVRTITGHVGGIENIRTSTDGRSIFSCSVDGTVKQWDIKSGALLRTIQPAGPYAGMKIAGVQGLSRAQRDDLIRLGAVED